MKDLGVPLLWTVLTQHKDLTQVIQHAGQPKYDYTIAKLAKAVDR